MAEQHLRGEARREDIRVELRILFPGAYFLELEHPAAQVRREHALLERFDLRQVVLVDLLEAAQVSRERARVVVDALPAVVLEVVVVRMNTIEGRGCWMRFVEVPEQVVDEMRKWFGNGHGSLNRTN